MTQETAGQTKAAGLGGRRFKSREGRDETEESSAQPGKIFARAVKLLAARPRSESELRARLAARAGAEAVDECILKLKELGFIDDARFAAAYARHRASTRPIGQARLARELGARGVARSTIDEALKAVFLEVDEETLIDRAIEKRLRRETRSLDRNGVKRLFDHLARLGFDRELIISRVRALRAGTGALDRFG